jgi:ATP-dependent Clp protease protease subunit
MLIGPIEDELASLVCAQLLHLQSKGTEPISIYINSPGGSITAGFAVYDVMRIVSKTLDVHTICFGQACSAASMLLCAGDFRSATKNSRIMIHQPVGSMNGQAEDLYIYVKEILRLKERALEIYKMHTNMSRKELEEYFDRDTIIEPQDAQKKGFIDSVEENGAVKQKTPKKAVG